jgi:uncharacterized protein YyaL (SSP411 family)
MLPPRAVSSAVAWEPWGAAAFARARAEHKAVLLSIGATWCHWCHEMDRTSYADPAIIALINDRFVPVRVDTDERPDISERYNLGGWPTTAFLSADGALLGGGTFVPADRMRGVLARLAEGFREAPLTASRESAFEKATADKPPTASDLTDAVFASFDAMHGGFGVEPKFPLTAPVQLALELWQKTGEARYEAIAISTLDAMGWGGLYDGVDGGFFRYATTRDWQLPHHEKLLDTNAALLRLYLNAGEVLGLPRFTERAADTLRYIQNTLADPVDGAWRTSQAADPEYYAASTSFERRELPAPAVGERVYTDATATMISAAFHGARVFGDDGLRAFAVKSLERVLLGCYRPGHGVAHWSDGEPRGRGLLGDQIAMATACLDAFEATDNVVYEMMAEELAHFVVRAMWDDRDGGFFDRTHERADQEIGLLRQGLKPFVLNCEAVPMFRRLATSSGEHEFAGRADDALAAMIPFALEQGPLAAHCLLAIHSSF